MMDYITIIKDDLPKSSSCRYLRLPHPRTGQPQLYLPYTSAEKGKECILEVVKINCAHRRSWFVGESTIQSGSIILNPPIDPLFLLIPILYSLLPQPDSTTSTVPFQPLSDLISQVMASSVFAVPPPFTHVVKDEKARAGEGWNEDVGRLLGMKSVKKVMRLMCEKKVVPSGPPSPASPTSSAAVPSPPPRSQSYYRPSLNRIVNILRLKVEILADPEEFEKFDHLVRGLGRDGLLSYGVDASLIKLARTQTACEHISQYLPMPVYNALLSSYEFEPLTQYLANRAAIQMSMAAPLTSTKSDSSVGSSGKTGAKRKAQPASKGVEALKKVNTGGMSKLTSFFKPKEGKK